MTVKVNYTKDAHNNGKNYFDTDILKGSLNVIVVFFKRQEIKF